MKHDQLDALAMVSTPYEGMWDFDGSCAPTQNPDGSFSAGRYQPEKFSLGCFQWVRKSSGKGLKRSPVRYRIHGFSADPREAFEKAKAYCAEKNANAARYGG